jgi:diguanylate cyclase (GGDEF)-like protein/PAS domain S-box-containing protein
MAASRRTVNTTITGYARELLDAAPDAMIISDSGGMIVYANNQTEALFGYSPSALIGQKIEMLLAERFRKTHSDQRAAFLRKPRLRPMGENLRLYARHRNGAEFRVDVRSSALQTDEGVLVSCTIRDITAREDLEKEAPLLIQGQRVPTDAARPDQHELSELSARAQGALNSISDAVISTDLAGHVTYLNPTAEKMTGWSRADATGRPLKEVLVIFDDVVREPALMPLGSAIQALDLGSAAANGMLSRRDGSEISIEHSLTPMQNDRGEIIGQVMVLRDVSATRSITQKLAYAAHHDALTGLPNRLLLESQLTQATALARRHNHEVAVLFLDLDGFKLVNDTFGHAVGDRVLESVAHVLLECVRSTDTVSRFGGDEFVVLLSEISRPADAVLIAQKILDALGMPHAVDGHDLLVTASIGIALFPHDATDPQTLLRHADEAMFHAKRARGKSYQLWSRSGRCP